jgi:integrase
MAFLWKHPKSKYFIAGFYDLNGKRRNRSTRQTNRREAEKVASAFEEAANKRRSTRQVRAAITALHKEVNGQGIPTHSFRQYSASWLETKKTEVGRATYEFCSGTVRKFLSFLGAKADDEMTEITKEDVISFRNSEAQTLTSKTVNHDLKCLRMLFNAAREDRIVDEDPTEFVKVAKKDKPVIRSPFTLEDLRKLIAVADEEMQSLIRFGLYTGQRLGDLAMLTWENIDLNRMEIQLVARKTKKHITVPIAPSLLAHIKLYNARNARTGPIHSRAFESVTRTDKTSTLSKQFGDLMAKAGLRQKRTWEKSTTKKPKRTPAARTGLSFHSLRHTTVSMMKEAGIPEAAVMELVGHDSEQMSAHYTHVGLDSLKKAAASLPVL